MGSRFLPWTYAVCLACLLSAQSVDLAKGNCKDFDFEKGTGILSKWDKTGHAFDNQPTYGDNARIRDPKINTNVQGDWWIGTFENRSKPYADAGYMTGDYPVGTLTSPKFRITGSKMSFLFGGGCDAGQIRVELLVNGQVARQAFADDCRDRMRRRAWDVGQLKNKFAQIRLVDASRKGHVNFDDLWGDFTCVGNETYNFDSHNSTSFAEKDKEEGEFVLVDEPGLAPVNASLSKSHENSITGTGNEDEFFVVSEPLLFVNRNESDGKPHENPIEGTDDEYVAVQNSSKPHAPRLYKPVTIGKERQEEGIVTQNAEKPNLDLPKYRPLKMGKGPAHQDSLLGGTKISTSNINTQPQPRPHFQPQPQPKRLTKALSVAKIVKASLHKLSDNSTNKSLPKDDDLRNLTCKSFLVKIKTGKAWDNDFLFTSNGNYQSTRREIEVRVLDAYEDDKDFRGSFFSKFSSSEEPGEIKAFFVLKFRAVGKFLGRLIDQLGPGNVSAAGCLDTSVISQCPSPCPHTCAPSCQSSCCQQYVLAPVLTPVAQCPSPCPQTCAPSCQSSCCQQHALTPVLTPVAQCPSPCPQTCAPSCQSSCCQQHALTPVITPVARCPSPCPKTCAPSCDSSCCQQHVPAPVAQCPSPCPQACAPSCDYSCCQQHVPAPVFTPVAQCPSPCPKTCAPSCDSSCCQQHVPAPVLTPVAQCPSPCPQACAPSCQSSCCQQYGFTPVVPQPVYQPAPVPMPPPPPPPIQMTVSRPQLVYEQPAQQWNPQPIAQVYATRPPLTPPPQGLSGSQCAAGCSPYCAPNCSPTCCQFLSDNTKRKGDVQTRLRKQQLEEEKH